MRPNLASTNHVINAMQCKHRSDIIHLHLHLHLLSLSRQSTLAIVKSKEPGRDFFDKLNYHKSTTQCAVVDRNFFSCLVHPTAMCQDGVKSCGKRLDTIGLIKHQITLRSNSLYSSHENLPLSSGISPL